jgi:hypothetical protein
MTKALLSFNCKPIKATNAKREAISAKPAGREPSANQDAPALAFYRFFPPPNGSPSRSLSSACFASAWQVLCSETLADSLSLFAHFLAIASFVFNSLQPLLQNTRGMGIPAAPTGHPINRTNTEQGFCVARCLFVGGDASILARRCRYKCETRKNDAAMVTASSSRAI